MLKVLLRNKIYRRIWSERYHCNFETLWSSSVSIYQFLATLFYRIKCDREVLVDPTKKKSTENKFCFGETLLCKSWHQFQLQLTQHPLSERWTSLQKISNPYSSNAEESYIFIYTFLCSLCKGRQCVYTMCLYNVYTMCLYNVYTMFIQCVYIMFIQCLYNVFIQCLYNVLYNVYTMCLYNVFI
jgi:hypothetical protein